MSPTTIMTVSMRGFVFRGAVLAVSALAHVLVYGALSLVPASTHPPRSGLIVTEVVVSEPTPPAPVPQPVTPPRPVVRAKPRTKPVEVAMPPKPTPLPTPTVDAPSPPVDAAPQFTASAETPREVTAAPPPPTIAAPSPDPTISSPTGSTVATMSSSSPSSTSSDLASLSPPASARSGSAAAVAALPPGPAAGTSGVTRTAIPRGGYQVTPSYPSSARRLGIEGTALLRVFVDATGHVGDIVVKQSAGHPDLDRAAADAVRRWRFDPARRGADAVAMWVELPVEFHLR